MRLCLRTHNQFYYMKKESLKAALLLKDAACKLKKKREFVVEANRLQIDQYMLGQIKKSKHSIKKLKLKVVSLKKEVQYLHDYRDNHLVLSKTQDRSSSSQAQLPKSQHKASVPVPPLNNKQKIKCKAKSKDSSASSRISNSSYGSIKSKISKDKKQSKSSNQRLAKKIQQLKAKTRLEPSLKLVSKVQVDEDILKKTQSNQKMTNAHEQQTFLQQHKNDQGYEQLLRLLITNNSIQPSKDPSPERIKGKKVQANKRQEEYYQLRADRHQKIQTVLMQRSSLNLQTKSNSVLTHYFDQKINQRQRKSSETNLLDSSLSIESPSKNKRGLKLSRCVDLRIINENNKSSQDGGFESLFKGNHFPLNTMQIHCGEQNNSNGKLRALQFQFDQLVRQQLISSDPRQKELLILNIRTVLSSIGELKDQISREAQ